MSRTAENHAWAILARHHYAQETLNVLHLVMLYTSQVFTPEEFSDILTETEAGLCASK